MINAERYIFCPPFMDFTKGYSNKDLQLFMSPTRIFMTFGMWKVEFLNLVMTQVRQREKVLNFRIKALFLRVILCAERHFKMNEIHR